jgi:hypothetical protein
VKTLDPWCPVIRIEHPLGRPSGLVVCDKSVVDGERFCAFHLEVMRLTARVAEQATLTQVRLSGGI